MTISAVAPSSTSDTPFGIWLGQGSEESTVASRQLAGFDRASRASQIGYSVVYRITGRGVFQNDTVVVADARSALTTAATSVRLYPL